MLGLLPGSSLLYPYIYYLLIGYIVFSFTKRDYKMMRPQLGIQADYELMLQKFSSGNMIGTSLRPNMGLAQLLIIFHYCYFVKNNLK